MPCLIVLIALFFPRLAIALLAIFSTYIGSAYNGWVLPVLGFIFMPFTTLAYAVAMNENNGVSGIYLFLVIIAAVIDIGSWGGAGYGRRASTRKG
ncbi:MAG: hypothetical protein VYC34_00185 [Planctomycetota bacterium]|nr:hypothetical protein [Planctomycetota bacterium]